MDLLEKYRLMAHVHLGALDVHTYSTIFHDFHVYELYMSTTQIECERDTFSASKLDLHNKKGLFFVEIDSFMELRNFTSLLIHVLCLTLTDGFQKKNFVNIFPGDRSAAELALIW